MPRFRTGFATTDLLGIAAVGALFLAVGVPALSRARELSKRMVCSTNLAGIGATGSIYSTANGGSWMIPPFRSAMIDNGGIDYLASVSHPSQIGNEEPGEVGFERHRESLSETAEFPTAGSRALSATRAFWMLVRSGQVNAKQFICPSSRDTEDPTEDLDLYYDFTQYTNVSYGYRVPFGPPETRPRDGADTRIVFAADKGPFYLGVYGNPTWEDSQGHKLKEDSSPQEWKPYNSSNHGGASNGEGQNALYADGHSSFLRTPLGGIDSDNIYTLMEKTWSPINPNNRIHGLTPHEAPDPPYPGQNAFGSGAGRYSSTDSLIYP